ncbi:MULTISPECIES: hypothetical protein [unclassified Pseudonocardia]|uniref:hypothetical protein n=1 Tax=unclassified Pseudonocardia TaxID=2619320 RepID=UPI0009666C97|nr:MULTISPECIES: hypothetical protein [unclassified Pseudonocardia]MBN9101188.1 hypothetical protein [Pseudonocardia sp.]OJY38450.1 MAG: hypothetical protein BGP03_12935 [Pseudonocardia sp. 73-21]
MNTGDGHRPRRPIRWTDRLIGSTLVAAAVTAVILVLARPADPSPPAPAPQQAAPSLSPTARLALDTQDCLKTTQTVEDLSQAVSAAGGARGPDVVAAADHAETRMGRRLATRNDQLHAVFADLKDAIALLQDAARNGKGGNAAIDRVLALTDTLDARCQAALVPTGTASPPTS